MKLLSLCTLSCTPAQPPASRPDLYAPPTLTVQLWGATALPRVGSNFWQSLGASFIVFFSLFLFYYFFFLSPRDSNNNQSSIYKHLLPDFSVFKFVLLKPNLLMLLFFPPVSFPLSPSNRVALNTSYLYESCNCLQE